jgi:hypothetical protein
MNAKMVEEIAKAVLYEGYMLYPYRASSVKNRQRWNFGVLYPKNYSELQKGTDSCRSQTECLIIGTGETKINVKVRFLQAISRVVGEFDPPVTTLAENVEPKYRTTQDARTGEHRPQEWQEASERDVKLDARTMAELETEPLTQSFTLSPSRANEEVLHPDGLVAGIIVRKQKGIVGQASLSATKLREGLYKVTLIVANETVMRAPEDGHRDRALMQALLSAHSVLSVEQGEFISLLEMPEELVEAASQCKNVGTWPVLVGEQGQRDAMLSSPIILYDYPQIAPESAGDLFDGTEIDEILALRILTLTDEEKHEMREGDARARQILERTEAMPEEEFLKLHGAVRGMRPPSLEDQQ